MLPEMLETRVEDVREWGKLICQQLSLAIGRLGFGETAIPDIRFENVNFELSADPYTQQLALQGKWLGSKQQKMGEIIFHVDGSFYAEFDVVLPHPTNARWFVESMTAWGREDSIKTDAKLLPAQGA